MHRWFPMFCKHAHIRCVHGDEINHRGGARVACLDCGRSLPGPLPDFCYATGELHWHRAQAGDTDEQ